MPDDFPATEYEAIHGRALQRSLLSPAIYEEFAGAWNAIAYRFVAVTEYEDLLKTSLAQASAPPYERCQQERDLFGFFSNGFSAFEAAFYGLFSLSAFLVPEVFTMTSPKDRQRISPSSTANAISKAFAGDPLNGVIDQVSEDPAYLEWREIRNILTHRAAPGRTFFVGIGGDQEIPDQWKIKDISLDAQMPQVRRMELSRLLTALLEGIEEFSKSKL